MEEILNSTEEKMMLTIESLENKFTNVRAGRANPNMLDGIMVEYYGVPTPLKSLANISIPEARQLSIKPFDRSCLGAIEKAIFEANLGVTPNNNGEVVFIVIPPLTEDRRKDLRLFDFIIPLRVGRPFQGERREVQTPPLCEYRLPVELGLAICFRLRTFQPISRAVKHKP